MITAQFFLSSTLIFAAGLLLGTAISAALTGRRRRRQFRRLNLNCRRRDIHITRI